MLDSPDRKPIITIDGPVGSGTTTVAELVAMMLGYDSVNTGSFYRSLTDEALYRGLDFTDLETLSQQLTKCHIKIQDGVAVSIGRRKFTEDDLRRLEVNTHVPIVSAEQPIRDHVRKITEAYVDSVPLGAVCEGRDAGRLFTWALPRIHLTASDETRSKRSGETLTALRRRDKLDADRKASPMMTRREAALSGYTVIDTNYLSAEQTADMIVTHHRRQMALA